MIFAINQCLSSFLCSLFISLALIMYHLVYCIKQNLGDDLKYWIQPKNADKLTIGYILIKCVT
jgi:hypothetical protein